MYLSFLIVYIFCTRFANVIIWTILDYYANIDYASSDNKYETFFTQFEPKILIIQVFGFLPRLLQ